jgi:peptidyl-prolyl cis-trans isomerase D
MKRNIGTKIVAYAMLTLLIASFGVWGIADYLGVIGSQSQWIARVNGETISRDDALQSYRQTLQQLGVSSLENSQARSLSILDIIVDNLVNEVLIQDEASKLGLSINDDVIREYIMREPQFIDSDTQRFNPQLFSIYLQRIGESESRFVTSLSKRIQKIVMERLNQQNAPPHLSRKLYDWQFEQRRIVFIRPDIPPQSTIEAPDDSVLRDYYTNNPDLFTMPSSRSFQMIRIAASDVMRDIDVGEDKIEERYAEEKDRFFVPAISTVERLVFETEEEARKAFDRLVSESLSFEELADGIGRESENIGQIIKGQSLEVLDEVLFALDKGEVSSPVDIPVGFALFHVLERSPERQKSLSEVRTLIDREIREEAASEIIYQQSIDLEDALASRNNDIVLASEDIGFDLVSLEYVTQNGTHARDGSLFESLPIKALSEAYRLSEGEISAVMDDGAQGYLVVRVTAENPESLRPYDTVVPLVTSAWFYTQRSEKAYQELKRQAQDFRKVSVGRDDLLSLSKHLESPLVSSALFTRNGQKVVREEQPPLPPEHLVSEVFNMELHHILIEKDNTGPILIWLEDVRSPEDNALTQELAGKEWERTTDQVTAQNLNNQLRTQASIEVNTPVVEALYDIL